jgi:DNA-binding transcriptional regulator YdaS (Cro superfamily)
MSRMVKSRWKSKFARFVLGYARREPRDARGRVIGGATLLTQHLGIRPSAIYHWVRGAIAPRPVHAAIIQRLARERGVRLTLDQIYGHSRELRATGSESLPFRKMADVVPISRPPKQKISNFRL